MDFYQSTTATRSSVIHRMLRSQEENEVGTGVSDRESWVPDHYGTCPVSECQCEWPPGVKPGSAHLFRPTQTHRLLFSSQRRLQGLKLKGYWGPQSKVLGNAGECM